MNTHETNYSILSLSSCRDCRVEPLNSVSVLLPLPQTKIPNSKLPPENPYLNSQPEPELKSMPKHESHSLLNPPPRPLRLRLLRLPGCILVSTEEFREMQPRRRDRLSLYQFMSISLSLFTLPRESGRGERGRGMRKRCGKVKSGVEKRGGNEHPA